MQSPVEELADFRQVILSPEERLAGCTPAERKRLAPLIELAEQLEALTEWPRDELLDKIGCDDRNPKDLAAKAKVDRCTSFLKLILDAAQRVETVRAHRSVVQRCARLSKHLNVDVLDGSLHAGNVTPLDLISLGELSTAVRTARIAAGLDQPAAAIGPSPNDALPTVHLSVPRVDLYVRGEREALGERTFERITKHLDECPPCAAAVETRRALNLPSR